MLFSYWVQLYSQMSIEVQKIFPGMPSSTFTRRNHWGIQTMVLYTNLVDLLYGIDGWCLIKVSNTNRYGQLKPILFFFSIFFDWYHDIQVGISVHICPMNCWKIVCFHLHDWYYATAYIDIVYFVHSINRNSFWSRALIFYVLSKWLIPSANGPRIYHWVEIVINYKSRSYEILNSQPKIMSQSHNYSYSTN